MKPSRKLPLIVVSVGLLALSQSPGPSQTVEDQVQVARNALKADRQTVVAENLQLTDAEGKTFWPLYHQYRAAMDQVGDRLTKELLEYAAQHDNLSEDHARKMLKELMDLEKQWLATRTAALKKIGKVLPATKTLRFAQVEARYDLAVRLEIAANLPLVPVTK
jgi:DNA-directed RNA polymerase subunit F